MAVATARVAGLASTTTETAATTVVVAERGLAAEGGSLGAVAGNVAHLTTLDNALASNRVIQSSCTDLVALGGLAAASAKGAVTGDVASLAALVAGLVVLHRLSAITA